MPPARVPRPLFVALALTMGIVFLVATRQHDTASWVPLSGASNYLKAQWSWSASKINELEVLKSFTHQPQGLTLLEPPNPYNYMWKNEAKVREVVACVAAGSCHPNALKFVVIGTYHCNIAVFDNYRGGEGIWCMNMIDSLERQGYTILHAGEADWAYMAHLHRQFPDNIKVILADDGSLDGRERHYEKELKSKSNPNRIPAWKFFRFSFFPNGLATVVGDRWSAVGEPEWRDPSHPGYRNITYLGYALPDEHPPVTPWAERPVRAYILSKRIQYFYDFFGPPMIARDQITKAYHELRKEFPTFEFVGVFVDDRTPQDLVDHPEHMEIPEGVTNLAPDGRMGPEEWGREVGNSRAMVGIGWPPSSPSPYEALARGVPFINPHRVNDKHDPNDPHTWEISQHEFLRIHSPPEVYQYPEYDYDAFVDAIRQAMRNEMKPHLLERMTRKALDERMRSWVEEDWRHAASVILENRLSGGKETETGHFVGLFEL